MGKIQVLSEELCSRIAAGEVIERPFSVVKELVENSIDAGAKEIEISIKRGGKDCIKVSDNGCGIAQDDMRAAFFPHATSKIKVLDDITHISTLGFRGEALATIASVALVELESAVEGEQGNKVECDGDFIGKVVPFSCNKGTTIIVNNLFFNTPVRFKFLKTDKKEEADITTYVIRYILGFPYIAFKYYVDGELKLQSYGGGLDEAITQIYGANILPNCFKIDAERNDIKVSGYISNQQFFKSNKTYQTTFLNGRYVNNNVISSSINNAYAPYMMKKNFPFYVLSIRLNDELVDVNAHPSKTDVRFADGSLIYGTLYKIISSILEGSVKAADFVVADDATSFTKSQVQPSVCAAEYVATENVHDTDFSDVKDIEKFSQQPKVKKAPSPFDGFDMAPYADYEPPVFDEENKQEVKQTISPQVQQAINFSTNYDLSTDKFVLVEPSLEVIEDRKKREARQEELQFRQFKYRGTLFNTYLMYEIRDEVYLIDQHAAHERILYDTLLEKVQKRQVNTQNMLVPYIFTVTPEERKFIDDNVNSLWNIGFALDPFGTSSFKLTDIPVDLYNLDPKGFIDDLLSNISEYKKITVTDLIKEKMAQTACKHAIKAGDKLTETEREKLMEMLKGNMGLKCPHGRPICVKLTKTELEKMFKRKV
ncbi:MAG: DNA mismatch repair endonuclease MutL [Candidatus Coproplasma sp.]